MVRRTSSPHRARTAPLEFDGRLPATSTASLPAAGLSGSVVTGARAPEKGALPRQFSGTAST